MDAAFKRLCLTIKEQKSILKTFTSLSSLISFKMADLANLALKHGYYFKSDKEEA